MLGHIVHENNYPYELYGVNIPAETHISWWINPAAGENSMQSSRSGEVEKAMFNLTSGGPGLFLSLSVPCVQYLTVIF